MHALQYSQEAVKLCLSCVWPEWVGPAVGIKCCRLQVWGIQQRVHSRAYDQIIFEGVVCWVYPFNGARMSVWGEKDIAPNGDSLGISQQDCSAIWLIDDTILEDVILAAGSSREGDGSISVYLHSKSWHMTSLAFGSIWKKLRGNLFTYGIIQCGHKPSDLLAIFFWLSDEEFTNGFGKVELW